MPLRPEENFVTQRLVEFLGGPNSVTWREGKDPPDVYFHIDSQIVALEITQLSPVSFGPDGVVQNINAAVYSLCDLCDELDSKLKHCVPDEIGIWLRLSGPVEDAKRYRRYKNELYNYLKRFIAERPKVGDEREINIANEKVTIFVTQRSDNSVRKIGGSSGSKNTNPYNLYIPTQAEIILADAIVKKQRKCEKVYAPIWLALLNKAPGIDHENYAQAIKNITVEHNFKKILLVMDTGLVHQIYEY